MDGEAVVMRVVSSTSAALRSSPMVPSAMFSAGVFEAVVALAFLVANTPEGIFSHHGKTLVVVYYSILTAGGIVGSATASASFWVARDLEGRHATGMALLCACTLTLIPVIGLLVSFFLLKK